MILINLLPHREAARKRRRDSFNVAIAISALVGGVIAGAIFLWYSNQIANQKNNNNILKDSIQVLEKQIKDIATLEGEIAALRARQQAVEDLQANRNQPVYLLTELSKQLPDGVYVTSMQQDGQTVRLQGVAQSNERVSELLRNLANNTPWFSKPELVEIVAANLALSPREQKRVSNFTMRVRLVRSSELTKAPGAAGAPAPAVPAAATPAAAGPKK
jgi:type IV pilus assembly protein PilN